MVEERIIYEAGFFSVDSLLELIEWEIYRRRLVFEMFKGVMFNPFDLDAPDSTVCARTYSQQTSKGLTVNWTVRPLNMIRITEAARIVAYDHEGAVFGYGDDEDENFDESDDEDIAVRVNV
jgi:hypothetical protein